MTPQEAIRLVYCCMHVDDNDVLAARDMAISALERQIPKKPKDIGYFIEIYVCPCCDNSILLQPNFCENCGQALDWGDEV